MTQNNHDIQETRQRLLDAAGEIFAEQGFRHTTIREICERAGANVAAVNYHFRDKEGLYSEVIRYAHRCLTIQNPAEFAQMSHAPAEQRLAAFISNFMHQLFAPGKSAWHGKLVTREMVEPTSALDHLVEQEIRPRSLYLMSLVRELIGPEAPDADVSLATLSVISQCVFYRHAQPVLARLRPQLKFTPEEVAKLAAHITRFSLVALKNWSCSKPGANPQGV
ncbi:MAG: CerR family C-terminal domain-containing protein [Bacillota bacterium]